jgi:hypothetical protein
LHGGAHQPGRDAENGEEIDHTVHREIGFKRAGQWLRRHEAFGHREGEYEHKLPRKRIESPIADVVNPE